MAVSSGGALKQQVKSISEDKPLKALNISGSNFYNNTAFVGGAIFNDHQSDFPLVNLYVTDNCRFDENFAVKGGALYISDSQLYTYGKTILLNNTASVSGGGVYLHNSKLSCQSGCTLKLVYNTAKENGGGIYLWHSSVTVLYCNIDMYKNYTATIIFSKNQAEMGGGMFLSNNSVVKVIIHELLTTSAFVFTNNSAKYGQDILVFDNCTDCTISKCFIQLSKESNSGFRSYHAIYFSLKQPNKNILKSHFGLCKVNDQLVNESEYLIAISNIQYINIGSLAVKFSFCHNGSPDLAYHPLPISKKKISVQVALFDQFGHAVSAHIKSYIDDGSILSHQRIQKITAICSKLNFTVFSSSSAQELIMSLSDIRDPYQILTPDHLQLPLTFWACISCPIGFEKSFDELKGCECVCNNIIKRFLIKCNASTGLITKQHTTTWIGYILYQNYSIFLIYKYCPLNYCFPPDFKVVMNLNHTSGADAQCAHNRSGLLCGTCSPGYSLSLGSSHCIPCSSRWPGTLVAVVIGSILGGITLVAVILILNLTVAVGTVNGLIFYANIAAANHSTFFSSTKFNIFSIINAWMNLELGIDTCFFEGMDAYWKTWIELAFPFYVITLVIIIIIISERSMKFAELIGRKNPVATLDTLILLAYVKFLSAVISSYSFAVLDYPDGSRPVVWLPDATVSYFSGKHIALLAVATIIIIFGSAFTFLLFCWQWLLYHQNKRIFCWIKYQRLGMFLEPYHAPYTAKHRYWTGLLLLVRIMLHITSSLTTSRDPRISIMITGITAVVLFKLCTKNVYKKRYVKLLEVISFANIVLLCIALLYFTESDSGQNIVSYISGSVAFTLLVTVLVYHFLTEVCFKTNFGRILKQKINRQFNTRDYEEMHLIDISIPNHDQITEPTYSVVDPPSPEKLVPLSKDDDSKPQNAIDDNTP